jgi:predicted phosphodiesterase
MNVLTIGDIHAPAMHPKYPAFLKRIEKKYNCKRVVSIGDLVDWNAISFHEKDPSMPSASEEFALAWKQVRKLHKMFPKVDHLIGNHDSLPARKAKAMGLPEEVVYDFKTLWELDGWNVHERYHKLFIDGVQYRHGDMGKGGQMAAHKNAQAEFCSVVQGHLHAQAGVVYHANEQSIVFGMQVGCGVMHDHPAMNYGRIYANKPILGCGVVLNGTTAIFEPMAL